LIGSLDASGPTVSEALRRLANISGHLERVGGEVEERVDCNKVSDVAGNLRHFLLLLIAVHAVGVVTAWAAINTDKETLVSKRYLSSKRQHSGEALDDFVRTL
jgi:hypothetical protein